MAERAGSSWLRPGPVGAGGTAGPGEDSWVRVGREGRVNQKDAGKQT